jgi:predicted transcriptional regulator
MCGHFRIVSGNLLQRSRQSLDTHLRPCKSGNIASERVKEHQVSEQVQGILEHVASIVSAFVEHNNLEAGKLPALISDVHASLTGLGKAGQMLGQAAAIDPKRSVKPDHIVCLEDGKKFKSLKRHLATNHGLTPDQYREKWGLPTGYPMVAPTYSAARSGLAKSMGLGRKPGKRNGRKGRKAG